MSSDPEPAKLLLPFLQRADELQKHEPLVAYYCRLFAMERGLKIPQKERTKTTTSILVSLMNQLEKDKRSLKLGPEDNLYVEGFASNVFAKADKQDRAGRADLNTAKTFYAASIFFEVLNQFGELAPDIEQKLKYAVWKAADIRKALKEGRNPEPGPPGGDNDLLEPSSPQTNTHVPDLNEGMQTKFSSRPSSEQTELDREKDSVKYSEANVPSQPPYKDLGRTKSSNYAEVNVSSQPLHMDPLGHSESFNYSGANTSSQPANPNIISHANNPQSSYSSHDYSSSDYPQLPPSFAQNYPQSYLHEQPPFPQNFPLENQSAPYSYPNFQSYPSFQESSFPSAPTHLPSHYQESTKAPLISAFQSTGQYSSPGTNGNQAGSPIPPSVGYKYDGNYQPPVEKISEAHKAARFAVGALAFDDVPVAVDFLRRSLELLTNPSAETQYA